MTTEQILNLALFAWVWGLAAFIFVLAIMLALGRLK